MKVLKRAKICLIWELNFRSFQSDLELVFKEFEVCFRTFFRKIKKGSTLNITVFNKYCYQQRLEKKKRNFADNNFDNILRLFDVLINFHQPQYKQCTNITCKHGIYELPQDLANDLRLKILKTQEIVCKCLNSIE